jgi:type II secretory ATPase GspE/PulE/Tfp pilus assembly ATPase PilB-like protein
MLPTGTSERFGVTLTEAQWQGAETRVVAQRIDGDFRLLWAALALGFVAEDVVANAIATQTQSQRYTHAVLPTSGQSPEARDMLKIDLQQAAGVAPIVYVDGRLRVVVEDPTMRLARHALAELATHDPELFVASRSEFATIIKRVGQRTGGLIDFAGVRDEVSGYDNSANPDDGAERSDSVVVDTVDKILAEAVALKASDIHFDPQSDGLRIEVRIDGALRELSVIEPNQSLNAREAIRFRERILARIVNGLGRAPFEEAKHHPVEGRFSWNTDAGRPIDVRFCAGGVGGVTTSVFVTLRLLGIDEVVVDIEHIGLEPSQLRAVLVALRYTHGYVLLSGPTGSGKSTSAHAMLAFVNTPSKKCVSIEKPVERIQKGVRQMEVTESGTDPNKNTWAGLLRLVLRADPDVIYCGEINDTVTAEAAMAAADTGHLMISTVHANTAVETMGRLHALDVSLQSMAHQGRLIVAQRLVPTPCAYCSRLADDKQREKTRKVLGNHGYSPNLTWREVGLTELDLAEATSVPVTRGVVKGRPTVPPGLDDQIVDWPGLTAAPGCSHCEGKGTDGRVAVFSVVSVRDEFTVALLRKEFESLTKIAYEHGTRSLLAAACCRVMRGEITLTDAVMSLGPGFGPYTL